MKKFAIMAALVSNFLGTFCLAQASDKPCYRYLISINLDNQSSKSDILNAMGLLGNNYHLNIGVLYSGGPEGTTILVASRGLGAPETRDQIDGQVQQTIASLRAIPGVRASCDTPVPPAPRMSGSN